MMRTTPAGLVQIAALLALIIAPPVRADEPVAPAGSLIGRNEKSRQQVLIGPMEPGDAIGRGGWQMKDFVVRAAPDTKPRLGRSALLFGGEAEIPGAKGDFSVHGPLPGKPDALGLWVCLTDTANLDRLGIQVYDAEGEALMMLTPADWRGWKWIEFPTTGQAVRQAYPQADKNGAIDAPLKSQHVVW